VVESLKDMVATESGSANVAGLRRMADYVERRLQALGARTERLAVSSGPGAPIVKGS
jgi:glutamate carboxypeptidase